MAKPIAQTPVLFDKDAVRFYDELEKSKSKIITKKEYENIKNNAFPLSLFVKK